MVRSLIYETCPTKAVFRPDMRGSDKLKFKRCDSFNPLSNTNKANCRTIFSIALSALVSPVNSSYFQLPVRLLMFLTVLEHTPHI